MSKPEELVKKYCPNVVRSATWGAAWDVKNKFTKET